MGLAVSVYSQTECGGCHGDTVFDHAGQEIECVACHRGRPAAITVEQGHEGLIVRPGELGNAEISCGGCHAPQVSGVQASPMHTGRGMVEVTRWVFGEISGQAPTLQSLGHGPADSLLRKLCASCHLGQKRGSIDPASTDPIAHRGGGCLACHLDPAIEVDGSHTRHSQLSRTIDDARCVGCHSRSARISLNYAGLAEVDPPLSDAGWQGLSQLADGRLVEHKAADVHHRAGMGCVDCHTGAGLMGLVEGVDIACGDCHDNRRPRLSAESLPPSLHQRRQHLGIEAARDSHLLQSENSTPLWHLEAHQGETWLYPKRGGRRLRIPQIGPDHFASADNHRNLTCAACHATWAPQCYGCHLDFDPTAEQWDHVERRPTAGHWRERRWLVRNDRPPLGVDAQGLVRPVVPGMVMSVDHPSQTETLFVRRFAAIAPHTTGESRRCNDCHGSSRALGLGAGVLERRAGAWHFLPALRLLADGLPADAWTDLLRTTRDSTSADVRPFGREHLRRLLTPID